MSALTASMCWNLIAKKNDRVNAVGIAIYQKPTSNTCYDLRRKQDPPLCEEMDDPNAAWYAFPELFPIHSLTLISRIFCFT